MTFNQIYEKHYKILHYILKIYHISYNYDEFYQLLLIKMWELTQQYQPSSQHGLSSFLFIRLKFYLMDLLRQQQRYHDNLATISSSFNLNTTYYFLNDFNLQYKDFIQSLNAREQQWLDYTIQGFQQYEIAQLMNLSVRTVKRIRSTVKHKATCYSDHL